MKTIVYLILAVSLLLILPSGMVMANDTETGTTVSNTQTNDQNLTQRVEKLLSQKNISDTASLDVTTSNGYVMLTGQVASFAQTDRLVDNVMSIPGVKGVNVNVKVQRPGMNQDQANMPNDMTSNMNRAQNMDQSTPDRHRLANDVERQIKNHMGMFKNTMVVLIRPDGTAKVMGNPGNSQQSAEMKSVLDSIQGIQVVESSAGSSAQKSNTSVQTTDQQNWNNPTSKVSTDASITRNVQDRLQTAGLDNGNLSVSTVNGVVTLTGNVDSQGKADRILAEVRSLPDVKSVHSELEVR